MPRIIPFRFAVNAMMVLLSLVLGFHLLVLARVIPYTIVWAGKLESVAQMQVFEAVSIGINAFTLFIVGTKGGYGWAGTPRWLVDGALWVFTILFALNTVGNLFAQTSFETIVFTPLTLVSALLCLRLATARPHGH